jgi:hypothetical protein
MEDGRLIGLPELDDVEGILDAHAIKLSTVAARDRFAFEFDFGDGWTHLCTVGDPIDAVEELGIAPGEPLSYFGWGTIPDQYGRQSSDDEGEPPPDPERSDLPALIHW